MDCFLPPNGAVLFELPGALAAQICLFNRWGDKELGTGAGGYNFARFQDIAAVCDRQRCLSILFYQQNGSSGFMQVLDDGKDLLYQNGGQTH